MNETVSFERVRRAAVLGSPIAHSLSPTLHRAAYAALGLDWQYDAIEVRSGGLATFLDSLDDTWVGLSLTMPLKEEVLTLGERLAEVSAPARDVRSVNTLIANGDGRWRGANTDIFGMVRALQSVGYTHGPGRAILIGAGATARSAIAACAMLGITGIRVAARRHDAALDLRRLIEAQGMVALDPLPLPSVREHGAAPAHGAAPEDAWDAFTVRQWAAAMDETVLWCCTLPADAARSLTDLLRTVPSTRSAALLDASYHPWPTPLARDWPGRIIASGRDMLLWQAVEQVRLMTGREPPVDSMQAALDRA